MEKLQPMSNVPAPRKERAKPTIVTVGNKNIISSGHWNDELMLQYVLEKGTSKWIEVGDLAKRAWGQNNVANKHRARKYLGRLWKALMLRGHLLSVEYAIGRHRAALKVKIYDPANEAERALLQAKIDRLLRSKELTEELYSKALGLLCPNQEDAA